MEASTAEWSSQVRLELERLCSADCATRAAILDAVERGVIAPPSVPGGWVARREGDRGLALYVLAERALSAVRGPCVHHQGGLDGAVAATIDVTRLPFREDARVECRIERTERRSGGEITPESVLHWRFGSGGFEFALDILPDSPEPDHRAATEQAERFARTVAGALAQPAQPAAR